MAVRSVLRFANVTVSVPLLLSLLCLLAYALLGPPAQAAPDTRFEPIPVVPSPQEPEVSDKNLLVRLNSLVLHRYPAAAIVYYHFDEATGLRLFVLTAGPSRREEARVKQWTIVAPGPNLEANLRSLRDSQDLLLGRIVRQRFSQQAATQLYGQLIQPAESTLRGRRHLIVVGAENSERVIPFLTDRTGKILLEKFSLSYDFSLAQLASHIERGDVLRNRRERQPAKFLIVGLKDFSGVPIYRLDTLGTFERQAREVASILHTSPFTGSRATEAQVKRAIGSARIIHLATHNIHDPGHPELSVTILRPGQGEDGHFYAYELLNLPLNAELVVLSACESALGDASGDPALSLMWSYFELGAASTIGSLWSVRDDSTTELMTNFYAFWRGGTASPSLRLSKAEALRRAQLKVRTNAERMPAYHWGAFVLYGDWR